MSTWSSNLEFSHLALASQDPLPPLTLVNLNDWGVVTLVGPDSKSYLQGQVTCDVISLPEDDSTLAAHCDAKGKVRTIFRLFHYNGGYGLIQRNSVMANQLPELKKYAIFSKTEITQSDDVILGLAGEQAQATIDQHFNGDGNVRHAQHATAVKIESDRWLIVTTASNAESVATDLSTNAVLSDSSLWDLLDIQAALPRIDAATELEFIPQAVNLQAVDGISFKKGCYVGQETVARAKYRGINKRAMYIISGEAQQCPQSGDVLERSVGDNWRKGGTIVAGYQFSDGKAMALVVLPNNLEADTQFRLAAEPDSVWQQQTLPYSLTEE